jgi:mitochondrial ATPase complex subunit ATP10
MVLLTTAEVCLRLGRISISRTSYRRPRRPIFFYQNNNRHANSTSLTDVWNSTIDNVHLESRLRRTFTTSSSSSRRDDSSNNNNINDVTSLPPPLPKLEDANPERIRGIHVNPDSLGSQVLPGNLVYKKYKLTGNIRKVPLELVHGYFWMLNDLKVTNQKPTLSNTDIIPSREAQLFPTLTDVRVLSDPDTPVDLPSYFITSTSNDSRSSSSTLMKKKNKKKNKNKNRTSDTYKRKNRVTLLALTFRDNGFKMLPSWTEPFDRAFSDSNQNHNIVQSFTLSITERWVLYPFRSLLTKSFQQNTPSSDLHKTLVCYICGSNNQSLQDFRDTLRLHNIMTGYVFLLDGYGRVRFAGSGIASDDEMNDLIRITHQLLNDDDDHDHDDTN